MNLFPNFSYGRSDDNFDTEAQTRWLIRKLVDRGEDKVTQNRLDTDTLPQSYTPANIKLREYEGDRDLTAFWNKVREYQNN